MLYIHMWNTHLKLFTILIIIFSCSCYWYWSLFTSPGNPQSWELHFAPLIPSIHNAIVTSVSIQSKDFNNAQCDKKWKITISIQNTHLLVEHVMDICFSSSLCCLSSYTLRTAFVSWNIYTPSLSYHIYNKLKSKHHQTWNC